MTFKQFLSVEDVVLDKDFPDRTFKGNLKALVKHLHGLGYRTDPRLQVGKQLIFAKHIGNFQTLRGNAVEDGGSWKITSDWKGSTPYDHMNDGEVVQKFES